MAKNIVIVGANLSGGAAASTLRTEGFEGRIFLIGEESYPPYERPPLSKDYLRGESSVEDALLRPAVWYRENDVELLLGVRATRINPEGRTVELESGASLSYDALLVATGGRNRRLGIPGAELGDVFDLRTIEDADRIRSLATPGHRAVLVGAGFIGCEVAASLRKLGLDVEVVEVFQTTLVRALGAEVGRVFEAIHRDQGVRLHFGQSVERFQGDARVEAVVTDRGTRIECDFALVCVGIEPATEVVEGSGVRIENGIVVDRFCRTSVDGVFAAGDVANHYHPLFDSHLRVEHWDNALKQGAAAARNMMGKPTVFDDPHWFWSDQYDHNFQFIGIPEGYDRLVTRGRMEDRSFTAFYLKGGVVRAVAGLDRGKDVRRSTALIRSGAVIDPALLQDEDVDLRTLAPAAMAGEAG